MIPTEAIIPPVVGSDCEVLAPLEGWRKSRENQPPKRDEFLDEAMTKQNKFTRWVWGSLFAWVAVSAATIGSTAAQGAGPVQQAYFEPDYEASGFVSPAGMPAPEQYFRGVEQAGFFGNGPIASRLGSSWVEGNGQCDSCDGACNHGHGGGFHGGPYAANPGYHSANPGYEGYGPDYGNPYAGAYGPHGCGGGLFGFGGIGGCLQRACLFCQGSGCGVCQSIGRGYLLGALRAMLPYGEAGIAAQRWYDLSADVMFLNASSGATGQVLTTQGVNGTPVLFANSGDDNSMAVGGRISGAFIIGPGGNVEVTYLGGNRWKDSAAVVDPNFGLFSYLSDFGTAPGGPIPGYDDTDRSELQSVASESTFHSGEVNYRRRTVGPYGRFQGSWLGGIRYLRFDSDFNYFTRGELDNSLNQSLRFFDLTTNVDNEMVGVQIGGDLWWNVVPGVNVGIGMKGGPMGNRIERDSIAFANSLGPGATPGTVEISDRLSQTAWLGEIEATLLYRLSHSWTLKTQYYLLNVDKVGYGFDITAADRLVSGTAITPIQTRSLTISGFTIGGEYVW